MKLSYDDPKSIKEHDAAWRANQERLAVLYPGDPLYSDRPADPLSPAEVAAVEEDLVWSEDLQKRINAVTREPETPSLAETIQDRDEEREDFLTRAYALHRVLSEQHHLGFCLLSSVTSGPDGNWCRTTEGDLLNVALGSLFSALQCVSLAIDAGRDTK